MTKIEELLNVLDLPEDKQEQWLVLHNIMAYKQPKPNQIIWESLADLAFRLRDEVLNSKNGTTKWITGMFDVYMKITGSKLLNWKWGYVEAQSIHWVIAALIALSKANKDKDNG